MELKTTQHVSFILLAEFDINQGSILPHQYPFPTGTDDQLLAELMIPDGAHSYAQDWTIFFLNQSPANTISPVFSDTQSIKDVDGHPAEKEDDSQLLYVLNLVQTKKDASVARGGIVKALAICTRHPFIQIFQPVILVALNDYFDNPSVEVLERLFDSVNSMDLSSMPILTRAEKLILRASERRDAFMEKFHVSRRPSHGAPPDMDSSDFYGTSNDSREGGHDDMNGRSRLDEPSDEPVLTPRARRGSTASQSTASSSSTDLGGEVWSSRSVSEDADRPLPDPPLEDVSAGDARTGATTPSRTAFDKISISSATNSTSHQKDTDSWVATVNTSSDADFYPHPSNFDTHFFPTQVKFNGINLPIKIPTATFPGEVGDYSLISLIQAFSTPTSTVTGPLHPHLHSNGALTHPIVVLFNALVTQKNVMFLGCGRPANRVANLVLAACALASGCGTVLRGFSKRAFPYTNLTNNHVMESVSGFIAGSTHPLYKTKASWDVLCDLETGCITVNKDIRPAPLNVSSFPQPPSMVPRSGVVAAVPGDDEVVKTAPNGAPIKGDFVAKADNTDNLFMEDILTSIAYHYGESLIRARFTDYVRRFIRLAARYEEETIGSTQIGFSTSVFSSGHLGSGYIPDEAKELSVNAGRIEGWRRSDSYEYYKTDFQIHLEERAIRGFDISHQISRLRNAKSLSDAEVHLIISSIANGVRTYDQIVELLALLPPHAGGLLPITFGLFHQQESIRNNTVDFLSMLRAYPIGIQFLQTLNHFHRMSYVRLAQAKELVSPSGVQSPGSSLDSQRLAPPLAPISRSPSNLSSSSAGASAS